MAADLSLQVIISALDRGYSSGLAAAARATTAFSASADRAETRLGAFNARMAEAGQRYQNLSRLSSTVGTGMMMAGGAILGGIVLASKTALQASSDLNESVSKSKVVFGDAAKSVEAFGDSAAKGMGMSKQQAIESTATLGNLFLGMGMGQRKAADMSMGMVKLAGDLASFNNLAGGTPEALEKIRSGLVGEVEPLRPLGVLLDESTVKLKGMEMGLGNASGELSQQEKVLARYQIILDKTKTAQGDFARTADGVANSQRILAAEFLNTKAAIGDALVPAYAGLLNAVKPTVEMLGKWGKENPAQIVAWTKFGVVAGIVATALGGIVRIAAPIMTVINLRRIAVSQETLALQANTTAQLANNAARMGGGPATLGAVAGRTYMGSAGAYWMASRAPTVGRGAAMMAGLAAAGPAIGAVAAVVAAGVAFNLVLKDMTKIMHDAADAAEGMNARLEREGRKTPQGIAREMGLTPQQAGFELEDRPGARGWMWRLLGAGDIPGLGKKNDLTAEQSTSQSRIYRALREQTKMDQATAALAKSEEDLAQAVTDAEGKVRLMEATGHDASAAQAELTSALAAQTTTLYNMGESAKGLESGLKYLETTAAMVAAAWDAEAGRLGRQTKYSELTGGDTYGNLLQEGRLYWFKAQQLIRAGRIDEGEEALLTSLEREKSAQEKLAQNKEAAVKAWASGQWVQTPRGIEWEKYQTDEEKAANLAMQQYSALQADAISGPTEAAQERAKQMYPYYRRAWAGQSGPVGESVMFSPKRLRLAQAATAELAARGFVGPRVVVNIYAEGQIIAEARFKDLVTQWAAEGMRYAVGGR